jgi:hypothetical protein
MSFFVFLVLGPQILLEPISIAYEVCVCVCVCAYPPGVVQVARVAEDSAEAPRKYPMNLKLGVSKEVPDAPRCFRLLSLRAFMSFLVFLPLGPQILSEPVSIAYEVCVCVCVCLHIQ